MTRYEQEEVAHPDGWSAWIYPLMKGYKLCCCDCGLVHEMDFRVTDKYDVEFRVRRNNRSTGQIRRHIVVSSRARKASQRVLYNPANSKKAKVARGSALTQK